MPAEDPREQPAEGIGHGVEGRAGAGDVHCEPQHRPHRGAGEHPALHGRGHHQQQGQQPPQGQGVQQRQPRQGHQQAGREHHQRHAVPQLLRLGAARAAGEGLPKEIGPAEGQRRLQQQLGPEGQPPARAVGEAAKIAGQGHHPRRHRAHEQRPPIDRQVPGDVGHGVDQHRGRDIADALLQPGIHQVAQGRAHQRRGPGGPRPGRGHQRHAEGRRPLLHPGHGHGDAQQQIDPAARGAAHPGGQPLRTVLTAQRGRPSFSPEHHPDALLRFHKAEVIILMSTEKGRRKPL